MSDRPWKGGGVDSWLEPSPGPEVFVAAAPARVLSDGLLRLLLESCFCTAAIRAVMPFPLFFMEVEDEREETKVAFAKNFALVVLVVVVVVLLLFPSGTSADAADAKCSRPSLGCWVLGLSPLFPAKPSFSLLLSSLPSTSSSPGSLDVAVMQSPIRVAKDALVPTVGAARTWFSPPLVPSSCLPRRRRPSAFPLCGVKTPVKRSAFNSSCSGVSGGRVSCSRSRMASHFSRYLWKGRPALVKSMHAPIPIDATIL